MRHEIQERICDECGNKKQFIQRAMYGPNPFCGWVKVVVEGNDSLPHEKGMLDFCSTECADDLQFLVNEKQNDGSEPR